MLKSFGFFVLWLGGSAAAVAIAWTGVGIVDDDLIDPAPAVAISAPELGFGAAPGITPQPQTTDSTGPEPTSGSESATLQEPTEGQTQPGSPAPATPAFVPSSTATPSQSAQPSQAPTATPTQRPQAPPPTAAPTPRPTAAAPTSTPASTQPPPPNPTSPPPPTPTSPAPTSTPIPPTPSPIPPTPTATSAPAQTLTFNLIGGTTSISFSPSGVTVLWAIPNPGFEVQIEPQSPGMKVEFRADHHRSRIDVWWSGGPRQEIREEPD